MKPEVAGVSTDFNHLAALNFLLTVIYQAANAVGRPQVTIYDCPAVRWASGIAEK